MTTERKTVDVVVMIAGNDVVLIRRGKEPFKGMLAFPGGHVEAGETLKAAAIRELREEINLIARVKDLKKLIVLNAPGRDPRPGHTSATVFSLDLKDKSALKNCVAGDDATDLTIRGLDSLRPKEMAFDHFKAIARRKECPPKADPPRAERRKK